MTDPNRTLALAAELAREFPDVSREKIVAATRRAVAFEKKREAAGAVRIWRRLTQPSIKVHRAGAPR